MIELKIGLVHLKLATPTLNSALLILCASVSFTAGVFVHALIVARRLKKKARNRIEQ